MNVSNSPDFYVTIYGSGKYPVTPNGEYRVVGTERSEGHMITPGVALTDALQAVSLPSAPGSVAGKTEDVPAPEIAFSLDLGEMIAPPEAATLPALIGADSGILPQASIRMNLRESVGMQPLTERAGVAAPDQPTPTGMISGGAIIAPLLVARDASKMASNTAISPIASPSPQSETTPNLWVAPNQTNPIALDPPTVRSEMQNLPVPKPSAMSQTLPTTEAPDTPLPATARIAKPEPPTPPAASLSLLPNSDARATSDQTALIDASLPKATPAPEIAPPATERPDTQTPVEIGPRTASPERSMTDPRLANVRAAPEIPDLPIRPAQVSPDNANPLQPDGKSGGRQVVATPPLADGQASVSVTVRPSPPAQAVQTVIPPQPKMPASAQPPTPQAQVPVMPETITAPVQPSDPRPYTTPQPATLNMPAAPLVPYRSTPPTTNAPRPDLPSGTIITPVVPFGAKPAIPQVPEIPVAATPTVSKSPLPDLPPTDIARPALSERAAVVAPLPQPVLASAPLTQPTPLPAEVDPVFAGEALLTEARGPEAPTRQEQTAPRIPEPARPVIAQIVEQLRLANGTIDVALSPEELGRLTLSLTAQDGALSVTVTAERPETLDLIRRHLDILQQEARDAGFSGISFDFGNTKGGDSNARHAPEFAGDQEGAPAMPPAQHASQPQIQPRSGPTRGLDIRL